MKQLLLLWLLSAIVCQAANPVANAGPDHTVSDYDGSNSVTIRLNASASTDADGDIVSYAWTWPGGSAGGQIAEGTFPATNTPVTVTLTVTDAQSNTSTDTMTVTACQPDVALFKNLGDRVPFSYTDATIAGQTVVLGTANRLQGVFRRNAGVWTQTPASGIDFNHFAVDENTIFGGNFYNGLNLGVLRYNGSEWVQSSLTLSAPLMPQNEFFFPYQFAADPQTVVVSDPIHGSSGSQTGRVFVYDWAGNNLNFSAELTPPGGLTAGDQFGFKIAVRGDLLVVASKLVSTFGDELHVYRKVAGSWVFEETLTGDGGYFIAFNISIGNGSILMARYNPSFQLVVLEKIGPSWVQTPISENPFGFPQTLTYAMNHDGLAFAVGDNRGRFHLFRKGNETSTWAGSSLSTSRLLTRDLSGTEDTRVTAFSNGLIAISDQLLGFARIIDINTRIDPINVEPVANAGADITTTSFDGNPVRVFLNGGASRDLNYSSTISAVWSWPGGSATGLQTFANIPKSVTAIELKITDNHGAISRDTINIDIDSPPIINAGPDVTVVDVNGDGTVRLNVQGIAVSQSNPIVSWNWRWPGGTLSSQSGTITLGPSANGQSVVLEAIDSRGLASKDEFIFRISSQNPKASILQAVDSAAQDHFGSQVSIDRDSALITAPGRNVTYLSENVNEQWQQLALSPETPHSSSVLIDGDTAYVGATSLSVEATNPQEGIIEYVGGVFIYTRQSGIWTQTGLITPPDTVNFNESAYAGFGATIAKSGNRLLIGMPGRNNPPFARDGAVFLFENVSGTWTFRQKLTSPDAESFGYFGRAIAISGDSLVVTSDLYQGSFDKDVAHIFTRGATQWQFALKAESDVPDVITLFGASVAMNDTEILIGASRESNGVGPNGQGVVYRYTKNAGTWARNGKLLPTVSTFSTLQSFGATLFLKNDILLVSAPDDFGFSPVSHAGRVHVLKLSAGNWNFIDDIFVTTQDDPQINIFNSGFGRALSHDGKDLIVGAPGVTTSAGLNGGKAYIFPDYAALAPGGNFEPLANAGSDISVTDTVVRGSAPSYLITEPLGSELVTLDGSASTDQENSIVSRVWTWPGGSASGATANVRFPVGTTLVTLTVTDSAGIASSDTVNVTVALDQTPPDAPPSTTNTLTVNLPVPGAKWRLSSEFLWHASGESAQDVVLGATYQLEIIGFNGSSQTVTTLATVSSPNTVANLTLLLPLQPPTSGTVSFPETSQGFSWRLRGEPTWRNVSDNGNTVADLIPFTVPSGELVIDYRPVLGFTTPPSQVVNLQASGTLTLNWNEYQRIDNFDVTKTFTAPASPNISSSPYQYVGMIRTELGRGSGTVVAPRVVLTAAHLFFDSSGLQWSDTQWFPRQQQDERQAPPITPRGIIFPTSYAKIVAPDSIPTNPVVPADKKEVDFAVLFFSSEGAWTGGSANYLESNSAKNWLTGLENKHAAGYAQRSQQYEQRGKIFEKTFANALSPIDSKTLPLLYQTGEVFGDGGASGSALFVQPTAGSGFYPAAILLAGQDRAVYRVIDRDVGRMIQDGKDASLGSSEVLDSNSSLVTYGGLSGLRGLAVNIVTPAVLPTARWAVKPNVGTAYSNLAPTQRVGFSNTWSSVQVSFTAVPGYVTPPPLTILNSQVPPGGVTTVTNVTYQAISDFDLWKQDRGISSDSDDRDGDGKNPLAEYAINGNVNSGTDPVPIRMAAAPSQNTHAEFEVYVSSTADKIRYVVKASNTLPPTNVVTLATFTKEDGTNGYKRVTDTQPRSASSKRFAWVEYTHDRSLPATP